MDTMDDDFQPPRNFALMAAAFEGGLAVFAVVLGWLLGLEPLESLHFDAMAMGIGVAATLPLLLMLWLWLKCPLRPCRALVKLFEELFLPLFRQCSVLELLVISLLAGLGEEMLFRGIIQEGLARWIGGAAGPWLALLFAALLFAVLHAVTPTYAVFAGLIGLYLGGLWIVTDNLLVPITIHAVYDFTALLCLVRLRKPG